MRKSTVTLLLATGFFAVAAVSAMVYARDSDRSSGLMMSGRMMGRGMMGGGMMGMMGGGMMQGGSRNGRPNEQWRDDGRSAPVRGE